MGIKSGAKFHFGTQPFLKRPPLTKSELCTFNRYVGKKDPMKTHHLNYVDSWIILHKIGRLDEHKVSGFLHSIQITKIELFCLSVRGNPTMNCTLISYHLQVETSISWVKPLFFRCSTFNCCQFGYLVSHQGSTPRVTWCTLLLKGVIQYYSYQIILLS